MMNFKAKQLPLFDFTRYVFFLVNLLLFNSCHDYIDHPLKNDEELYEPGIADITTDQNYNIEVLLDRNFSDECTFVLERNSGNDIFLPVYFKRISPSLWVDSTIDKEVNQIYTYRYQVMKNNYRSEYSNEFSINYESQTLNQPSDILLIAIENTGLELRWKDNSHSEDGYIIERNDGSHFMAIASLPSNSEYYFDTGIPPQPSDPLHLGF
jgi:hypothetical protein